MAVMMSGGIGLRLSGLAPERFIAVFYTGLGAALLLAGLLFGRNYGRAVLPQPPHTLTAEAIARRPMVGRSIFRKRPGELPLSLRRSP